MANNQKQILFRYYADEHPELDTWLDHQNNRTQSIIHALEKVIVQTNVEEDLVKHSLRSIVEDVDESDDVVLYDGYKDYGDSNKKDDVE